ncbi:MULTISPECIES: hypothetical protein [Moorena]|uniref:Uncharacterized protein n=1 Tax=Moorena producens 3L TaxID=489825 RepID=F4Y2K3_9CYAN|nr:MULTISPECIES: hypothetical protein [Moorena]NEP35506.1 hypothetical protein [Moorena sp. SIO3B2]NEQ13754.1 hypothetical protein [Moorena sp. SIO3E2]NES80650.1 hypothetical protein [Moorena sp. SIO2B7]NET69304.1 hypothetical protein [Moorena sp. SIO1G6]EGJ28847.1 hypothetical protein LYNGBM3L_70570 [Moorena producens 3L]
MRCTPIRLAWGHKAGGRNYIKYKAAREMLERMIEELNEQGFNAENNLGFDS